MSKQDLTVTEGGATDTYTFNLATKPTGDTVLNLQGRGQATFSPSALTFTGSNYASAQTVTVTAIDDNVDEDEVFSTTEVAYQIQSPDYYYSTLAYPDDFKVSGSSTTTRIKVMDNDAARIDVGCCVTQLLQEGGAAESVYTLKLHTNPPPGAVVQVNIDGHGKLVSSPSLAVLQSTTETVTIKLSAVDDQVKEAASRHFNVTHSVSCTGSGCKFASVDVANVTVYVQEDDTSGVQTSETSFYNQVEGAGETTMYVSLKSKPLNPVTVTLGGTDVGNSVASDKQVRVKAPTNMKLTFTNDNNWNQQQSVRFEAYDDATQEAQQTEVTMTLAATSSDGSYNGIDINPVKIYVVDNDQAGTSASPDTLVVTEGGQSMQYSIRLASKPTHDVTVTTVVDGNTIEASKRGQVAASPQAITFTGNSWNQLQAITVTAVDDDDDEPIHHYGQIKHTFTSTVRLTSVSLLR